MEKRLTDLGRPEYIDQKMFHNLIEEWYLFFWLAVHVAVADV